MTDKIAIDRSVVEQALKLLDALSYDENYDYDGCFQHWADYARPEKLALQFRAALEQPQVEQEPVAWLKTWNSVGHARTGMQRVDLTPECETWLANMFPTITPLYTRPQPKREPLTDEAEHQCPYPKANPSTRNAWLDGWEAAERAHGIGGEK